MQERTANITSHVDSIERYWSQNKEVLTDFDTFKNTSNYEVKKFIAGLAEVIFLILLFPFQFPASIVEKCYNRFETQC